MPLPARLAGLAFCLLLLLFIPNRAVCGDIVHDDDDAPKRPGCKNKFVLVKVQSWIDGNKEAEVVGVSARFGKRMETHAREAPIYDLEAANPSTCCNVTFNQLDGHAALVHRGDCPFTRKARVAQAAGASAMIVVNTKEELYKMVCDKDDPGTFLDIKIPAVLLPKSAGENLEQALTAKKQVKVQLYSPGRPAVDAAEFVLWIMAVGTITCASIWSAWSFYDASGDRCKLVKENMDHFDGKHDEEDSNILNINVASAVLFVLFASAFLFMIYKLMSTWFLLLLVILFCIGGAEGLQACSVALLSRWLTRANGLYANLPFIGPVSLLTLIVSPFCITFATCWAVYRHLSFAWVAQDVLMTRKVQIRQFLGRAKQICHVMIGKVAEGGSKQ